ncbi:AarF domain-containing protein kinase 1, partial [Fragariocoptes setiger]
MILPIVRYTLVGAASVGSLVALKNNDWNLRDIGAVRFGRAFATAATIAADYKFSLRGCDDCSEYSIKRWSTVHRRSANRLLELCCRNGGIFIKVGQHIAALQYMVPPEYVEELSVLHDKAPRTDLNSIRQVIREDLHQELEELFEEFDPEPVGAASFAQVHRAKLKSGQEVAVKVQHPRVRQHSYVDMTTMDVLVNVIAELFPNFSFLWLADSTKKNIPLELDFTIEGANADKARDELSAFKWLKIPTVFWELSSPRILFMEFVTGGKIDDMKYIEDNRIDKQQLTRRLGTLYCDMIFNHGHVHCDPHPGNLLVRQNDQNGVEIVLLDHGLYTKLSDTFRLNYSSLWLALIQANMNDIKKYAGELGVADLYGVLACVVSGRPWSAVARGITEHIDRKAMQSEESEIKSYASRYMYEINQLLSKVPREFLLIFKTNDLLRSIETRLGTKGQQMTFIIMTRYCSRNVHNERLKKCQNWKCRAQIKVSHRWIDLKLSMYQLYLWFKWYFTRTSSLAIET